MSENTQDTVETKRSDEDKVSQRLRRAREIRFQMDVLIDMLQRSPEQAEEQAYQIQTGINRLVACMTRG